MADLTPQGQRLQGIIVLPLVVVGQPCPLKPPRDTQAEALLKLRRAEVVL